jgi:hypothetical protein
MSVIPKNKQTYWKRNSLLIVFLTLTLLTLVGQTYTGWLEHNKFLEDKGAEALSLSAYFSSGHFIQATFENWESEFLQMGLYIILTVSLYQKGSAESKSLDEVDDAEREPVASASAPWAVRKGGFISKVYENSLSLAFILLFFLTWVAHFYGSLKDHNTEELLDGKPGVTATEFIAMPKFWFESFQNWQSEFLAVASIVFLTIYLRQKGSAQSKPVDTPNDENE